MATRVQAFTGAAVNSFFSWENVASALGVQVKGEDVEVSLVKGAATLL